MSANPFGVDVEAIEKALGGPRAELAREAQRGFALARIARSERRPGGYLHKYPLKGTEAEKDHFVHERGLSREAEGHYKAKGYKAKSQRLLMDRSVGIDVEKGLGRNTLRAGAVAAGLALGSPTTLPGLTPALKATHIVRVNPAYTKATEIARIRGLDPKNPGVLRQIAHEETQAAKNRVKYKDLPVFGKRGWSPLSPITDPAGKAIKLARGKLVPARRQPKHAAEAVTPWSRYWPSETKGKRIAKSFVPKKIGGDFFPFSPVKAKRAIELTPKERAKIKAYRQNQRGVQWGGNFIPHARDMKSRLGTAGDRGSIHSNYRPGTNGRAAFSSIGNARSWKKLEGVDMPQRKVVVKDKIPRGDPFSPFVPAGESTFDGRGGGYIRLHPKLKKKLRAKVLRHEMAHVTPRRNPIRAMERMESPRRAGREEGRADFLMENKPTPGDYPGSKKFLRGYNEVQAKMAAAQQRKVAKSMLPNGRYVKALNLRPVQREAIKTNLKTGQYGNRGQLEMDSDYFHLPGVSRFQTAGDASANRAWFGRPIRRELGSKIKIKRRLSTIHPREYGLDSVGGHAEPNGLGGGKLTLNGLTTGRKAEKLAVHHRGVDTLAHEKAHLTPKRNPVRFAQRYENPVRRGREEARADWIGRGKKPPRKLLGGYPGDKYFQRGYREVTEKLKADAARRKS